MHSEQFRVRFVALGVLKMRGPTFVFALSLVLATTATLASPDRVWRAYGRPHQLVEIGNGRHLNLFCLGTGSPTVILDGGLGADMSQWRMVHADLARTARVCAYDRAGNGFSDSGPLPRTAAVLAADLDSLLHAAHLPPPYVLVGSSLAGLHTRLFADTHLKQVVGMVLVDPSFEHQTARYEAATPSFKLLAEQQVATLSSCIDVLRAGMPAPGSKAYKECIGEPEPDLPPEVTSALAVQTTSDSYRMVLSELHEFDGASSDQIDASRRSYGDMPLIVLTAGGVGMPDPDAVTRMKIWITMHDQMAALSLRGINRIVPNAKHHIMLSRPEAVIAAVDEVVAAARASSASTGA
jgi:pimeloyl-ACP methyl ester carboxylesterase